MVDTGRWGTTAASRRKGSTEAVLSDFGSGMVRFLVGTQMLAKGHDFKRVGLVVVVNADVSMNLPDFRSGERTFQILTQVAGRAGRGEIPGKVVIQTFNPDHHSLSYVTSHDFKGFYLEEAPMRKELGYPPFARLVRVVAEASKQARAESAARRYAALASRLARDFPGKIDVIGQMVDLIKAQGVPAGVGGHSLNMPIACEKNKVDPDFYVKTFHIDRYWSATPEERRNPSIIDGSRRKRISRGSGTKVQEVNRLLKQFADMQKMFRSMKKGKRRGMMKFPGF